MSRILFLDEAVKFPEISNSDIRNSTNSRCEQNYKGSILGNRQNGV